MFIGIWAACDFWSHFWSCSPAFCRRARRGAPALERGTAIIDPIALRELDRGRFGLGRVMLPARSADAPLANSELFALPSMVPVRKALDAEFDRYIARHKAGLPNETIGVGNSYDFQLFDRALLDSANTRFVLAGIVNRMDRAYVHAADCGEIRLIYRLTRTDVPETTGEGAVSPRLPMTLNVVLKARGDAAIDGNGKALPCAEIARRWLAAGELPLTGAALAERLTAKDGPLSLIGPEDVDAYRDQSADRACAEIAHPGFSHRLSPEGVRLRRASAGVCGSAAGEPDRS